MLNKCLFGCQSLLHQSGHKTAFDYNKINVLIGGEGSTPVAFPPPVRLEETFSRDGRCRIFPLFSGVIAEKLFTSD